MKLLRIGQRGRERPAIRVSEDAVLDVSSAVDDYGPEFFATGGIERLRQVVSQAAGLPRISLHGERIGPPVARPHKIVCIGLNYADHAAESGLPVPDEPVVFFKATNTIVGPNDDVLLPRGGEKVDWEVELAIVVGSECRYLADEEAARSAIAGYCISNDVSERHFQLERGGQWVKGKSCETFTPWGPRL